MTSTRLWSAVRVSALLLFAILLTTSDLAAQAKPAQAKPTTVAKPKTGKPKAKPKALPGKQLPIGKAQECPEGECGGGGSPYLLVSPHFGIVSLPSSSSGQLQFTVENHTGNLLNLSFSCLSDGTITCTGLSTYAYSMDENETFLVNASYTTAGPGMGHIYLYANGAYNDMGWYEVTTEGPAKPVVSFSPHNSTYLDVNKCVMSCFAGVYGHSTPPYFSVSTARALTLTYNSQTHKPTPIVWAELSKSVGATTPTAYSIQIRRAGTTPWMTLLNGSTIAYFSPHSSGLTRIAAVFDAATNQMDSTGSFDIQVAVSAHYGGTVLTDTSSTRVLITSQSRSAFGAGFDLKGYQRLFKRGGPAGDMVITEGDGSVAFYDSTATGYVVPLGAPGVRLAYLSGNPASSRYIRTYLDGTTIHFNDKGFMTKTADRFGTATTFSYYAAPFDTLLQTITDPVGKTISVCYNAACTATNSTLHHVNVLSGTALRTVSYTSIAGRISQIQDPDGYAEGLAYGANGLLAATTDRAGQTSELFYDAMNLLDSLRSPSVTLFDGTTGRPKIILVPTERTVWQPNIPGTSVGSPKAGIKSDLTLQAIVTDPLGASVKMSPSRFGSPLTFVDAFGSTTQVSRDSHGRPTNVIEPNGRTQTYTYNGYGQLTSKGGSPSGQTILYYYKDSVSSDLSYITGDRVRNDFHYYGPAETGGPVGALKDIYVGVTGTWPATTGGSLLQTFKTDAMGRDIEIIDPGNHSTRYTYDGTWGNLIQTQAPDNTIIRVTFDSVGRPDSSIAPARASTKTTYGQMNQVLTQSWGSPGFRITNIYNPATLAVVRVETPRVGGTSVPVVYKYSYNALGMLVTKNDAVDSVKADTLKYDLGGNLRRVNTRRGDQIDMTYDKAGRLLTRSGPGFPTDSFMYDTLTASWQVAFNSVARDSVHFDSRGRLDVWRQTLNTRTYTGTLTYDSMNRITRRVLKPSSPAADSSVMEYVYAGGTGARDSLCTYANPKRCVTMRLDADFGTDSVHYNKGGGGAQWWLYREIRNSNHQLTSIYYPGSFGTAFDAYYYYDGAGRNTVRTSPKGSPYNRRVFTYDALGRLTNACDSLSGQCQNVVDGTNTTAWSYDSTGNRNQIGITETYGLGNRLTAFGSTNISFNASGAAVCKIVGTCPSGVGSGHKYSWDALGRLRGIRNGSTGALIDSMYYDALGRRVRKQMAASDEYYVYEGDQVVLDVNASGTVLREYAWFPGATDRLLSMRSATPVADTLAAIVDPINGTVRGMARFRTGTRVKEFNEAPWGDAVADTGVVVRYHFAGREYDSESGLYYMRARYYDPATGRWLSEDPIGIAGGVNLYAYAADDPVNLVDPSGLCPQGYHQEGYYEYPDGHRDRICRKDRESKAGVGSGGGGSTISFFLPLGSGRNRRPGSSIPGRRELPGQNTGGGGGDGHGEESVERPVRAWCSAPEVMWTGGVGGSIGGTPFFVALAPFLAGSVGFGMTTRGRLVYSYQGSMSLGVGFYGGVGTQVNIQETSLHPGWNPTSSGIATLNVMDAGGSISTDPGISVGGRFGVGFGFEASAGVAAGKVWASRSFLGCDN